MKHADIKAMMAEVAPVIREYAAEAMSPVVARLDAVEKRLDGLPKPDIDGMAEVRGQIVDLRRAVSHEIETAHNCIKAIPLAPELPDIPAMVNEAVAAIPAPQDGKSVTVEDVRPVLDELVSTAFSALPVPRDGADVDMDAVAEMIGAKVIEAFAGVELPKDGKDGRDGIDGKDGVDGVNGRDGLDAVEFLRGADGHLIVTMSNGTTRDLGRVNGKDGEPGRDGFGFDDMMAEYDGERTVTLVFTKGDHVERFPIVMPIVIYQGVFKDGMTYAKGDSVSYGGSIFIAQNDTTEKPEDGSNWKLSVKRGRDGKDGTLNPPPKHDPVRVDKPRKDPK